MNLEMMDIVRRYIYAERSGNWTLHLATVEEMLLYLVSAGHMKYTACVPQYIAAMKSLPASVERVSNGELYCTKKGREV